MVSVGGGWGDRLGTGIHGKQLLDDDVVPKRDVPTLEANSTCSMHLVPSSSLFLVVSGVLHSLQWLQVKEVEERLQAKKSGRSSADRVVPTSVHPDQTDGARKLCCFCCPCLLNID